MREWTNNLNVPLSYFRWFNKSCTKKTNRQSFNKNTNTAPAIAPKYPHKSFIVEHKAWASESFPRNPKSSAIPKSTHFFLLVTTPPSTLDLFYSFFFFECSHFSFFRNKKQSICSSSRISTVDLIDVLVSMDPAGLLWSFPHLRHKDLGDSRFCRL